MFALQRIGGSSWHQFFHLRRLIVTDWLFNSYNRLCFLYFNRGSEYLLCVITVCKPPEERNIIPLSPSLTLQLVLRRPPLQQRQVADDVLQENHLGRRQGGSLLGRWAPPQRQMLLRATPLCGGTTRNNFFQFITNTVCPTFMTKSCKY